jgi:hypothetical protein
MNMSISHQGRFLTATFDKGDSFADMVDFFYGVVMGGGPWPSGDERGPVR